jgi:hypothetical protein
MRAPIILFTYARIDHTLRTVESLLQNAGSSEHDLIVYSDAPRTQEKQSAVAEVREYLKKIKGFRSVTIRHREYNFGLAKSIIEGVTEVLKQNEQVIVLEDDMVTSPYFLTYMNDALVRFANDDKVISVHGYVYPTAQALPEAFFLRGADCWGWATWRRGWALFNPNGQALLNELRRRHLIKPFDFNDTYGFSKMLESQIKGLNDSWAIRWYASAFLANKLTLYPGKSLVQNIGNDSSGTHCASSSNYNAVLCSSPINLTALEVAASEDCRLAFEDFFRNSRESLFAKLTRKLSLIPKKVVG